MNLKAIKKTILTLLMLIFMFFITELYAGTGTDDTWWTTSVEFFKKSQTTTIGADESYLNDITEYIKLIGNAAFLIVTVILGIKYMLASAEGKADIKGGLTNLVVAAVFFYGWSALQGIFTRSMKYFFVENSPTDSIITPEESVIRIYETIIYILNYVAVGVIIYVGVKYLLSSAEGKADLKGKGLPFLIGLVMTFSTITFLNFIIKIIGEVL